MVKTVRNWFDSANYDLITAQSLLKAKRKVYVVFMCHLAIEKMLKGIFCARHKKLAPYTHNLIYLVNLLALKLPEDILSFIETINDKSVPTRYPENIKVMEQKFSLKLARDYLKKTKDTLTWLKRDTSFRK
jgi:HEPN domain-containing protein